MSQDSDDFSKFMNAKDDEVDTMLNKKSKFQGDTFGDKKASKNQFNSDQGFTSGGNGYGYGYDEDVHDDPYAFDIDLNDNKVPSENELGKYSYSESDFASKERSANKSARSDDEHSKRLLESGEFKKSLKPIEEAEEFDPKAMDRVKAVSFNNPVRDSEEFAQSENKSEEKYSDTFENVSATYKHSHHTASMNPRKLESVRSHDSLEKVERPRADQFESRESKFGGSIEDTKDKFSDNNIRQNRFTNDLHDSKVSNNHLRVQLNEQASSTNKFVSELNEIKLKYNMQESVLSSKDKTVEECKNQLTKANELITQYRVALEDTYKQIDAYENNNNILKDEIKYLHSELEKHIQFKNTQKHTLHQMEVERKALDLERKFTTELNEKDRVITKFKTEVEEIKRRNFDLERRNKDQLEKINNYENSIEKLNKENESLETETKKQSKSTPTPQGEQKLAKKVGELEKQVKTQDSLLNGYQRENERMLAKENLMKKDFEKMQEDLQAELRRNTQLQQQLLRQSNQILIADDTIDLNKTQVSNLILGGETIGIRDLTEIKNQNKQLQENLSRTITENRSFKEKESEHNDTMTKQRIRINELEMQMEGIDPETFKRENDVMNNMTKEFNVKENRLNDRIKDLESKLKFQVENQELIETKNQKIQELEEKVGSFKDNKKELPDKKVANKPLDSKRSEKPVTKKEQKAEEKSKNMDMEMLNNTLKEQTLVQQRKIQELNSKLEETEQEQIDKIRSLRQENNIKNMSLFDQESNPDKNEDDLKGRELLVNQCALLKDLSRVKEMLTVDHFSGISHEVEVITASYNTRALKSLNSFASKVGSQLKDLNDVNKVHRLQRVKVIVNKYYNTLEARVKNLLQNGKDTFGEEDDLFGSTLEEKGMQVQIEDESLQAIKESVVSQSNLENTHLLNTNFSIATSLLQEKIERLEKEKQDLIVNKEANSYPREAIHNNWTNDESRNHKRSEIKHISEFNAQDDVSMAFRPSFVSGGVPASEPMRNSASGSDIQAKVEQLEAFNQELSLRLKQLMTEKNALEEKVQEQELSQQRQSSSKLDSLQLERLMHKVEDMEHRHSQEMQEMERNQSHLILSKDQEIMQVTQQNNKELTKLKGILRIKNDELEKMKRQLEEIEDDLIRLKQ